ncbi:MAG: hypothetical protein EA377_04585 [Phycisphaerales bacterium]|nr:MAG: hypothetical protein EA377_04585 [Phycisphaerales bacterium]
MLEIDDGGVLTFLICIPGARRVDVVGVFSGWHEQRFPMERVNDECWRLSLRPGPGEHQFRYLVNEEIWLLDATSHGTRTNAEGIEVCRVWMPPAQITPDSIAA